MAWQLRWDHAVAGLLIAAAPVGGWLIAASLPPERAPWSCLGIASCAEPNTVVPVATAEPTRRPSPSVVRTAKAPAPPVRTSVPVTTSSAPTATVPTTSAPPSPTLSPSSTPTLSAVPTTEAQLLPVIIG